MSVNWLVTTAGGAMAVAAALLWLPCVSTAHGAAQVVAESAR